jgi:hypothetical protein
LEALGDAADFVADFAGAYADQTTTDDQSQVDVIADAELQAQSSG